MRKSLSKVPISVLPSCWCRRFHCCSAQSSNRMDVKRQDDRSTAAEKPLLSRPLLTAALELAESPAIGSVSNES